MSKKKKKNKKVSNKRMNKKTKAILSVVFAVIFIFLLFSLYVVRLEISSKKLDNEFDKLLEVDITKGDYKKNLVCVGKYRTTEKLLKEYFSNYSGKVNDILNIINSDEFTSILAVDTYEDGKVDMEELVTYTVDTKEDLDALFKEVNLMSTNDYMLEYLDLKDADDEVKELFLYYMTLDKTEKYFKENNKTLKKKQTEIDNILDVARDLYYFLVINKGNWIIKDNKIQFSNTLLMNQYNAYIEKLK